MKTQLRTMGLGLMVAAVVSLSGVTSTYAFPGQGPRVLPLVPPPVVSPVVPRLGIMGHIEHNRGMKVDSVIRGTTASRVGLERGDLILRINGMEINSDRDYRRALLHALQFDSGVVKMQIADVRSGRRVFRTGQLNRNPGLFPSRPFGDDTFGHAHHDHDHHPHFGANRSNAGLTQTFESSEF